MTENKKDIFENQDEPSLIDLDLDLVRSLTHSEDHFKLLVELLPMSLMVHRGGKIIYVNPSWLRLAGYDRPEELIGESPFAFVHPDYMDFVTTRAARLRDGLLRSPLTEIVIVRKNGEQVPIEVESVAVAYHGIPSVMVVGRDISVQRKAQEAIERSEDNLKAILENMPDGVALEYPDRIHFVNQKLARMLGYDNAEELIGRAPADLVHPDHLAQVQDRLARAFSGDAPNPMIEYRLLQKDGNPIDVDVSSVSMTFGNRKAVLAFVRDISDRKRTERILREKETRAFVNDKLATVGTLAAGVAHEINNPLSYILANLHFIGESFGELEGSLAKAASDPALMKDLKSWVNDTVKGAHKIKDIVKCLKVFARTNDEEIGPVQVNEIMEFALTLTSQEIKYKAGLEKQYGNDLPALQVNSGKLQQVFVNLLLNAAQSIELFDMERNRVSIRTGVLKGEVFIEVADTGVGILEADRQRIFDPFFTTKPVGMGNGMGLSLCDEIVRSYGGRIEVKSQFGKGSAFTVFLPIGSGPKAADGEKFLLPKGVTRKRVLMIEDDPENLEAFSRMLRDRHQVLSAASGSAGMAVLERENDGVDVIVSDLNMPDMDGIEFYRQLQANFPGLEKKVIFMTGGVFTPASAEFLKTVPNRCLEKPFDVDVLLEAIHSL